MPWGVHAVSELRLALVHAVRSAGLPVAEAARRYGVSRKTAFKWLARHDAEPEAPLIDRSRRPRHSPGQTPAESERAVLEARDRWGWGPRKLHAVLRRAGRPAPPVRTIAAIAAQRTLAARLQGAAGGRPMHGHAAVGPRRPLALPALPASLHRHDLCHR